jgi:hypothetical protein
VWRSTLVLVPSERQLIVLGCLHAYEVAAAVFATTPLCSGDDRYPGNLAFRLKSENSGATVADDAPNASATTAAIDDEDALAVAFGAGTNSDVCHGKFTAFNEAFACKWNELDAQRALG